MYAAFGLFSIQLGIRFPIKSINKYFHLNSFKEELLFCSGLEKTTKAVNIFGKASFFESEKYFVGKPMRVLYRRSPSLLGTKSGFQAYVKKQNSNTKGVHCMIHRYALASKTLPPPLRKILDQTIT